MIYPEIEHFCPLPWISIEASPVGTCRVCCLNTEEIRDANGDLFRLQTASIDNIRNSEQLKQLRTEFLAGSKPMSCSRCWDEESAGRTSKRQHSMVRLQHINMNSTWNNDVKDLVFVDLKLGNTCNLKCRICGPWSSSSYAVEEIQHSHDKKRSFAYQMLQQGKWIENNKMFWHQLYQHADHIKYIEFTGGEPFLIQQHFDFLQYLVTNKLSAGIEIHYNTNGTVFPRQAEVWSNFKLVEVAISVDDMGHRFEYQRSNASWQQMLDNLGQFLKLRTLYQNIHLQLCATINIFNVLYFEELALWANSIPWNYIHWNMLHDAPQWCIAKQPQSVKQGIIHRLHTMQVPKRFQEDLEAIIKFVALDLGVTVDARPYIAQLDKRRNQNLHKVMPELAALLQYEGDRDYKA